jgi:hypothetical protein
MDDRSTDTAYEAPGVESRQAISLPLIGVTNSAPLTAPSAAFRTVTGEDQSAYEPPRVEERATIDEPLVAVAQSGLPPV